MDFGRILTAMVTPFDNELEVDYLKAEDLAKHLVANGSDGIVVAGTTGESPTLSKKEKYKLFEVVKGAVGDKNKVIAGTGSNNTRDTIEMTKEAEAIGVDGVMLVVPYYNKPCQEGLYAHFKAVAESTSLPIMLYNIPGRSVVNLTPDTVAKLAKLDNIVAIKEAAGNLDQVVELVRALPKEFKIYSGDDALTLPMLALGCHGIVSVVGHVVGNSMSQMIKSYLQGDVAKAAELNKDLFPIFKGMFMTTNPVPIKEALTQKVMNVGGVRLPLIPANEHVKLKVSELLEYAKANNLS